MKQGRHIVGDIVVLTCKDGDTGVVIIETGDLADESNAMQIVKLTGEEAIEVAAFILAQADA